MRKLLGVCLGLALLTFSACESPSIEDTTISEAERANFKVGNATYSTLQSAVDAVTEQSTTRSGGSDTVITLLKNFSGAGAIVKDGYTGDLTIDFGSYTYTINMDNNGIDFNEANAEIKATKDGGLVTERDITLLTTHKTLILSAEFNGTLKGSVEVQEGGTLTLQYGTDSSIRFSELTIGPNATVDFATDHKLTLNGLVLDDTGTIKAHDETITPSIHVSTAELQTKLENKMSKSNVVLETKASQLIEDGIVAIENGKYDEGVALFNQAYDQEQTDETRIYSALASLASLSTKEKTLNFVKNHLGITNYPATMNALFSQDWLEKGKYVITTQDEVWGITGFSKSQAQEGYSAYYRARRANENESESTICCSCFNVYTRASIDGQVFYPNIWDLISYETNTNGKTSHQYENHYVLDDQGDYYVGEWDLTTAQKEGHQAYYPLSYGSCMYHYDKPFEMFELEMPNWFTNSSLHNNFVALMLSNILNKNTEGLNSALDDLYEILFSTEYEDACTKIDAVKNPVKVPQRVIVDLGFDDIVGKASVYIGPTEMKLIEASFTALKATLEYFQSYNFDMPDLLASLKLDWADKKAWGTQYKQYLDYTSTSNPTFDPLRNNFLDVRDAQKMVAAKTDFKAAIDQTIVAYDDILKNNDRYLYPTTMMDKLNEYKALRVAAEKVKAGIDAKTKLYLPDALKANMVWPETGEKWVDLGKLFDNETFAMKNFIVKTQSGGNPRIWILYNQQDASIPTKTVTVVTTKEGKSTEAVQELASNSIGEETIDFLLDTLNDPDKSLKHITFGLKVDLTPITQTVGGFSRLEDYTYYVRFPESIALLLYNYYHGGKYKARITDIMNNRGWWQE